jgi:hypothetical protein
MAMISSAASAQEAFGPDAQKIDSMSRNCVYNSAFYSQGAIVCLGRVRGLQCSAGSWVPTQDLDACKEQVPVQPPRGNP